MKLKWMTIALMGVGLVTVNFAQAGGDYHSKKHGVQSEMEMEDDNVTRSAARGYDPARIYGDDNRAAEPNSSSEQFEAEEEYESDTDWMTTDEPSLKSE